MSRSELVIYVVVRHGQHADDNVYVFRSERYAFEYAARYMRATVSCATLVSEGAEAQFLIDTAEDDRDPEAEPFSADEVEHHAAGVAGRTPPQDVSDVAIDEDEIRNRAAYLRGRAGLSLRPGAYNAGSARR